MNESTIADQRNSQLKTQSSLPLMNLTAEFLKLINSTIPNIDVDNKTQIEHVHALEERISRIMKKFEKSELQVLNIIDNMEKTISECSDVVYIRYDKCLKAVISRDITKPTIRAVNKIEMECKCKFDIKTKFEVSKGYFIVESEQKLRELDSSFDTVVLGIFDHSYRTYDPFTCIIAVYVPEGFIYIIDAIKYREVIPSLRLLKCGVKKIFTSQFDVERIYSDFGRPGCYVNFNIFESDIFIDWRIRPINEVLCSIICDSLIKAVEKINMSLSTEIYIPEPINDLEKFISDFNISDQNLQLVVYLIKLRDYLAKQDNEGVQFVMTDSQLYNILVNMPSSLYEFESLVGRMSSIIRLHVGDFLIILNKKSKIFSLEGLKNKSTEKEVEGVCLSKQSDKTTNEESESDFVISDE